MIGNLTMISHQKTLFSNIRVVFDKSFLQCKDQSVFFLNFHIAPKSYFLCIHLYINIFIIYVIIKYSQCI